jgi:hypothetical protein
LLEQLIQVPGKADEGYVDIGYLRILLINCRQKIKKEDGNGESEECIDGIKEKDGRNIVFECPCQENKDIPAT